MSFLKEKKLGYSSPSISATIETIDDLSSYWHSNLIPDAWNCLFLLPPWLEAWHSAFADNTSSEIVIFRNKEQIIGAAPVLISSSKATIMGSPDVCDYTDIIAAQGYEEKILFSLLDLLASKKIDELLFSGIREDNPLYPLLLNISEYTDYTCTTQKGELSFEKKLPPTWQGYLDLLNGKQRHEIRRKMRRVEEAGDVNLRIVDTPKDVGEACDVFLQLFISSRKDKARFMNEKMSLFFKKLLKNMSTTCSLRLFFLEIDRIPAAAALCFEYNHTMYLYNSGYNQKFSSLSVGMACKILSIQIAIERGCTTYDFLKGEEPYKHRLGGTPVSVCQMRIHL